MPKTNINDLVVDGFRAEVSWRPDGDVQVATVNQNSPLTLKDDEASEPYRFDGWHVTLDRVGINRLIRALREARDAAFGADA